MIGVVDVGGGERGVFGAGVLDYCMEYGIDFDCCYGVSAGAANLVSYLAGQKGRNFAFYSSYSFRKEYMSLGLFAKTGEYADLDYIYGTLSNSDGEYPLDFPAVMASEKQFHIVATDAETAQPVYFTKDDMSQDDYAPIKASSALPLVNRPVPVRDGLYFDGGLSDPIPVSKALKSGCDKVVLILTRPRDFRRKAGRDAATSKLIERQYPQVARALANRANLYNFQLDLAERLEREGRVLIVAPDTIGNMDTLTRDVAGIEMLYGKGYAAARAIQEFIG